MSDKRPTSELEREHDGAENGFRVEDRRHWASHDADDDATSEETGSDPDTPSTVDIYRRRAEDAEGKLQEYIDAFKTFRDEQEQVRARLARDVDRRVDLKFGELVGDLLESLDELDLALGHAGGDDATRPIVEGLEMTRRRFLQALERHGVEAIVPDDEPFDPNVAEAVRMDPVEGKDRHDRVTETLRPGYRLGERVIRPARVAVGRHG